MTLKTPIQDNNSGFISLTAVVMLTAGLLVFSAAALNSALVYADSVNQRELRMQAGLNAKACRDTVALMAYKDYFLAGTVQIREFGCIASITNDGVGRLHADIHAILNGVSGYETADMSI